MNGSSLHEVSDLIVQNYKIIEKYLFDLSCNINNWSFWLLLYRPV